MKLDGNNSEIAKIPNAESGYRISSALSVALIENTLLQCEDQSSNER